MLNDIQGRIIKEISENKILYMSMISDKSEKDDVEELYDNFFSAFQNYQMNLLNEIGARVGYNAALKSKKIDPFVAGGIGQGVAGTGAGIYVAANTAINNKKIDANRKYYKNEVFQTNIQTTSSERQLLDIAATLDCKLDSIAKIREYRENELEKLYHKAKGMMSNILNKTKIIEAEKIFRSLGNYKDSSSLADRCDNRKRESKQVLVLLYSILLTVFVVLFSRAYSFGSEGFWTVSICAFVISEIILQFYIKCK